MPAIFSLLRTELAAGVAGLRLFIACVALGSAMLIAVAMLAAALVGTFERNGRQILGGDAEIVAAGEPLGPQAQARLAELGTASQVVDLRSSVRVGERSSPIELRAVDDSYPLYGGFRSEGAPLAEALTIRDGRIGLLVERSLLARLGLRVGDPLRIGSAEGEVRGVIASEPDRLSAGRFLIGPRVILSLSALPATGLVVPGTLAEYRYRIRFKEGVSSWELSRVTTAADAPRGVETRSFDRASGRTQRIIDRTTTFLGVAGIVALAIALAGAWAAAGAWVRKRSRTIALYRLSGAGPLTVAGLHGLILALAALIGVVFGGGAATGLVLIAADAVGAMVPVPVTLDLLGPPALAAAATMLLGVAGAGLPAIAGAANVPPGAAMRSGEAPPPVRPLETLAGIALIAGAAWLALTRLPAAEIARTAATWLILAALALAVAGALLAAAARRVRAGGFVSGAAVRGLSSLTGAAAKALAIGIGIVGITAVESIRTSLDVALRAELPERTPELVLLDIQTPQRDPIETAAREVGGSLSVEMQPRLRAAITDVNGRSAMSAAVGWRGGRFARGDHSLSWSDGPMGEPLVAGEWWPVGYDGPPLLSIDEDVAEAFRVGLGDRLTFSVLGRAFEAVIANVREDDSGTFGLGVRLVASPEPLRHAPQTWTGLVEGERADVDAFLARLGDAAPGATIVDVRSLVEQVTMAVDGAALGVFAVAGILLVMGGMALAAVVAADADARAREALAFTLVGASRTEIARARFAEIAAIGLLAALVGGAAGLVGGWWLTERALRIAWLPGWSAFLLPPLLGVAATVAAGLAAGLGALPRGRGEIARRLSA